jgi:hypothetical protein
VEDWNQTNWQAEMVKHAGAKARLSAREVLILALAGRWCVGVAWQSERGVVRWLQGRRLFAQRIGRSAFHARVGWRWAAFIGLQQLAAALLEEATELYACVDCVPVPARKAPAPWLWESTTGQGGTGSAFYMGDKRWLAVSGSGLVSAWLLGHAAIQDRWLLEAFRRGRAGQAALGGPAPATHPGHSGAFQAVGLAPMRPYLADRGFNSRRWPTHCFTQYAASLLSGPADNDAELVLWSSADRHFLAAKRQSVETALAFLSQVFGLKPLTAQSRWGQSTPLAAPLAAYNMGLVVNRALARPLQACPPLLA